MRPAKVELTEYQQHFLWMKQHNILLDSIKQEGERFITVSNKTGLGIGKTIKGAIDNYIQKHGKKG